MPELANFVAHQPDMQEELEDVMKYGIYAHVPPWEAVRDYKEDMEALMASDNFDHGHGLADSELRCIRGVRSAILTFEIPPASSQFDVVAQHVQRLAGHRWQARDINAFFFDFAKNDVGLALGSPFWRSGRSQSARMCSMWICVIRRIGKTSREAPAKSRGMGSVSVLVRP